MFLNTLTKFATTTLLLVSMVKGDVAITSPLMSTWQEGSTQFITWTDNGVEPKMSATFDLYLMSGPPTALQPVIEIVKGVDSSKGQYEWIVPTTLKPGKDYAIRAGVGSQVSYSPYFELVAGNGDAGSAKESPSKSSASSKDTKSPSASSAGSASASPSSSGSLGASKPISSGSATSSVSASVSTPTSARLSSPAATPSKPSNIAPTGNKTSDAPHLTAFMFVGLISLVLGCTLI